MVEACFFNDGRINNQEFEKIVLKYHRMILGYVKTYYLPGGDYHDMYQWGLIGLFKAVCHYDEERGKSFRLIAELNIKNTIKSAVTMHNRKKHYILNEAVSLNNITEGASLNIDSVFLKRAVQADPAVLLIEEESINKIKTELSEALSRLEKRVVDLYIEGYKPREISSRLDLKEKVVDNAIQRARSKLSLRLKDWGNFCTKNSQQLAVR